MFLTPTRREFMKIGAMSAGALLLLKERVHAMFNTTQPLRKFTHNLRRFGVEIPPASADSATYPGVDYYRIAMRQYTDKLHPDLPDTTLWGYGQGASTEFTHLGGAILAREGRPVRITWENLLPVDHILPVDTSLLHAETGDRRNHAAPHLHGGLVPWVSDGGPFHWFDPDGIKGGSVPHGGWLPDASGHLTNDYWYPNKQTPRMMWYHDHGVGITRLNAYAGLATGTS